MILGGYLFTVLVSNLFISKDIIGGGDGSFEGSTAPMVDFGT